MDNLKTNDKFDNIDDIIKRIDEKIAELEREEKQSEKEKESVGESLKNKQETIDQLFQTLDSLVGLQEVKEEIKKLYHVLNYQKKMEEMGYPIHLDMNLNMIFLGNPGTGKTTIARFMQEFLYTMGYIRENKLLEVTAKDLISGYVGQTALKTGTVLEQAKGGILFIDEAYILGNRYHNDFAEEVIVELIKAMEERDIIFIFAGYEKEMNSFIESNPGIQSRIGRSFFFADFKEEELKQIFLQNLMNQHLKITSSALHGAMNLVMNMKIQNNFGNARTVKNLLDTVICNHAYHTKDSNKINELITIQKEDLPSLVKEERLGF